MNYTLCCALFFIPLSNYSIAISNLSTLSINSIITSNNFNIYPNPATNNIHINSIRELNDKNYKIFNGLGELFSNGTIKIQKIKIEKLEKGVYYIIIESILLKLIKN